MQAEFMQLCGHPQFGLAAIVDTDIIDTKEFKNAVALYTHLIDEECNKELRANVLDQLINPRNIGARPESTKAILTLLADDIGDTLYVVCGLANTLGLWPILDAVYAEIHRANMTKAVDGKIIRRADGKILKPEGWTPPNIAAIIELEATTPYETCRYAWPELILSAKARIANDDRFSALLNKDKKLAASELRKAAQELEDAADIMDAEERKKNETPS